MTTDGRELSRRGVLRLGLGLGAAAALAPRGALAHAARAPARPTLRPPLPGRKPGFPRTLSFFHLHTGESLTATYWADGGYLPAALADINWFLRDFRTGEKVPMDVDLLDLLWQLHGLMDTERPFEVVSGYRSKQTNARLRRAGHDVARRSFHLVGMAADIALPGRRLSHLVRAARWLKLGGVGYYPSARFIHVDTGPVRYW